VTTSTHLDLPFILPAQAQKHITHNEALIALDVLTQLAVLDRHTATPPVTPTTGDRYIVAAAATGDWAGHTGDIAHYDGAAWLFYAPQPGWCAFVLAELGLVAFDGTDWLPVFGLDHQAGQLGINTAADPTNRLAVKSDAVLLSHDDVTPGTGDMRLVMNKATSADTVALLFQTGFSGRAEFGTAGDDKLHLKLSPDGSTWAEALVADPATGRIGIGTATPLAPLDVAGPIRLGSATVATLPSATAAGQLLYISNESGGPVLAFSDGSNWRRVTDRAVVS
jgi:hypothetical protein